MFLKGSLGSFSSQLTKGVRHKAPVANISANVHGLAIDFLIFDFQWDTGELHGSASSAKAAVIPNRNKILLAGKKKQFPEG